MTESDGQNLLAAIVQERKETDFERRSDFCHFTRNQMQVDNNFIQKILFSDEAKFSNNGSVNKHNCHYYAQENPLWIRETHFQRIVSLNVWCGIFGDRIMLGYTVVRI
jgi:hypothetical protein